MRRFWLAAAMNAVTLVLVLVLGETAARLLSSSTPEGIEVAGVLLPRSWEETVARNRDILRRAPREHRYFVDDEALGWTVGPNRTGRDGLYASSAEGIRSARPGVSYAGARPPRRIALVGDSFTFGLEVPFEDSWAQRLQQDLGEGVQVLNFGVDGYGVDQAYLRYLKDVRPWRPDLVIFGFINHDLYRSMAVYAFVSFPEWGLPFGKPRFVVENGKLELLNTPVPTPEQILLRGSVSELPFIELDPGYRAQDWEWRPYYRSLLARFLASRLRRAPVPNAQASDAAMTEVNAMLLSSFEEIARKDGSATLVVYFPSRGDYSGQNRRAKDPILQGLGERKIAHENLTACLGKLGEDRLFIEDRPHYSPAGNAAAAACLEPAVRSALDAAKPAGVGR